MTLEEAVLATGAFWIDELGRVWRVRAWRQPCEPRRAEHCTNLGYLQVRIMVAGKRIHAAAHRVVWTYFNGPIPVGMEVNHRNGLKDDNRPENLALVDPGTNTKHAHRCGLKDQSGERNPACKLTDRQVAQIRLAYAQGGYTQFELARRFGISYQAVSKIVRGQRRAKQCGPTGDYAHRRQNAVQRDPTTGRFTKKHLGRLLDGRTCDGMPKGRVLELELR